LAIQNCRICRSRTKQFGFLFKCESDLCSGVHWDKSQIKKLKKDLSVNHDLLKQVLSDANVPEPIKAKKSHFVYVLRLKGELNSVYVGMTGLHPYARYLNHLRGHRSSRHSKKRATALMTYEGPMSHEDAKIREPKLADELRQKEFVVYGGH
jgi:predicted GIY-YIG superfamily endonuclease